MPVMTGTDAHSSRLSLPRRAALEVEHRWDAWQLARRSSHGRLEHFRIETYYSHGAGSTAVVRGRVLDNPAVSPAAEGEGIGAALRRTLARFLTVELPDVPLLVELGGVAVRTRTDAEGYFVLQLEGVELQAPWTGGTVSLAEPYLGVTGPHPAQLRVQVPGPAAAYGVISDIDDTILRTGVQKVALMVLRTFTGSALTRTPFVGAPELYRALAEGTGGQENPVAYVSSSPWNLHDFLARFLDHRGFPLGALLLRDLLGSRSGSAQAAAKRESIEEVLELHPGLPFVLIGDSGEHDPAIYADVVRDHPGRIKAVWIREVRLDPGDGKVEAVTDAFGEDVPFLLAADSAAVAEHAARLGLIPQEAAEEVMRTTGVTSP